MSPWIRLMAFLQPYPFRVGLSWFLGVLTVASNIGLMVLSAYLLSRAALRPPILDLMVAIVGVRFFGISRAVFRYLERLVSHDLTFRILKEIRTSFYEGIEPLAPARLLHYRSGDLFSRIGADVETLQYFFLRVTAPPLIAGGILLGYSLILGSFDSLLTLVFVFFYLVGGIGVPLAVRALSQQTQVKHAEVRAELTAVLLDSVRGMGDLLVNGAEERQQERVVQLQGTLQIWQRRQAWLSGMASALTGMAMHLGMGAVLALAVLDVSRGRFDGVFLAALPLGVVSSFEAVFPLGLVFSYWEQSLGAARRLWEVLDSQPGVDKGNEAGAEAEKGISDQVRVSARESVSDEERVSDKERMSVLLKVDHLSFRYEPTEPWVLKDVSFEIQQGKKVALIGTSGAGKSTLVNILLRFWEAEQGSVSIGGRDSSGLTAEEVREFMGVVTQRTHLFNATIRENLLLAKLDATEEELGEAMRQAHLQEWIRHCPDGYDTYIGEDGLKLSGGQRQRLAIARALLKNAPLLILDEATSGLDPETERAIFEELRQVLNERTALVITHHLDILPDMDEVLVLAQGRIVERGKHADLIRADGMYARLWSL